MVVPTTKRTGSLTLRARVTICVSLLLAGACSRSPTDGDRSLTLSPPTASLFAEDSTRFTAVLRERDGTVVPVTPRWSISDPSVAMVDSVGTVRAVGAGSATVRAALNGMVAEAGITVAEDDGQVVTVEPTVLALAVGDTGRLTATVRDRHGRIVPATVQWSSANRDVAIVDDQGLVQAVGSGAAAVQAALGSLVAGATVTVTSSPPAVLIGAGDIAMCDSDGDEATAALLDDLEGTVVALGDNVYPRGTRDEYDDCYGPTWGRHKARTRPVPGNHDYETAGAAGYYDYFGAAAGDPARGYYSYNLGTWHVIALNSNVAMDAGSAQEQWLRADLAAHPAACTLAYLHHPRFTSGPLAHAATQPLWQALYEAGAEIVLVGHAHNYERFAPQTPAGQLDLERGIREYVVGTGGAGLDSFSSTPARNSEVRNGDYGVIKLTLHANRYEWEFVPIAGESFRDTGSAACH